MAVYHSIKKNDTKTIIDNAMNGFISTIVNGITSLPLSGGCTK